MGYQDQKFRLQVIETNDGTKMYHPQAWVAVNIRKISKLFNYFLGSKKWEEEYIWVYDWRGIIQEKDGYNTLTGSCSEGNGFGSSDINVAKGVIETYKIDLEKRREVYRQKEKQDFNNTTKEISYIEIPT